MSGTNDSLELRYDESSADPDYVVKFDADVQGYYYYSSPTVGDILDVRADSNRGTIQFRMIVTKNGENLTFKIGEDQLTGEALEA